MKYKLACLFALLAMSAGSQTLKTGDNVKAAYRGIARPFFTGAPSFSSWVETRNMYLVSETPDPPQGESLFLALRDSTIIGAFHPGEPPVFLIDNNGDSILTFSTEYFVLPAWVVKRYGKIDAGNKEIPELLNKMYETTLQADYAQPDATTLAAYKRYRTDNTLANRHIVCLFDNYQNVIAQSAADKKPAPANVCLPLMKQLSKECLDLWGSIPTIVCIYMGEALLNAGMTDNARKHFAMCLQYYPNSIPIKVYNYRLEQNEKHRKVLLKRLKKEHSKHWMVMTL